MKKDELVRAAILKAAEAVFRKWGITKTTMEDIAHEAGKGKSTLYYYFKSKEDVLDAAVEARIARIAGLAREEIAKKNTAREKLAVYFYTTFREFRKALAPYDMGRVGLRTHRDLIDDVLRKVEAVDAEIVESILSFGLERKEFKSIGRRDLKATTRAILTIKRSLTIDLFIDNRDKQLIDLIIRMLSEAL
jgi:AcrR family transcriptional regulator